MVVTLEISLYPLKDSFEETILSFIHRMRTYDNLYVQTHAMSTYVKGDWNEVMDALKTELDLVWQHIDTASTVIKIVNRDLPIEAGYLFKS